jgi:Gas vesicle synthesis protein GvpL/GvpF
MKNLLSQTRKALNGGVARSVLCRCRSAESAGFAASAASAASAKTASPARTDDSQVVWVYAVTTDLDSRQLPGLTGVAGEPVRVVTEAGLSAVVGTVSDSTHSGKPLTNLLVGLTAIEKAGRAHHDVIAWLADDRPVLPLRLATVYPDDATIRMLLAERHTELNVLLESFRGTQEWGVKVYVQPWANGAECDPFTRIASEPGRLLSMEPLWAKAEACAEDIGQALSDIAVATRRRPSPDPRFGDDSGWMVLNGAYLLDAERADEFAEIVESVTAEHAALRADVTGPWPPYSFADRQEL